MVKTKMRKFSGCLMITIVLTGSFSGILPLMSTEGVQAAIYDSSDVQDIINSINGTMNRYNSSLCRYEGDEGVPSEEVNYTLSITLMINEYMDIYNSTLSNYSNFPSLLDEVGDNLTEIETQMLELNSKIIQLDSIGDDMDTSEVDLWDYLDENYDRETITEEDYDDIVDELMESSEFTDISDEFVYDNFDYIFKQDEITDDLINITIDLSEMTLSHYGKLYDYEHIADPLEKKSEENKTTSSKESESKSSSNTKLINHNHIETGRALEKGIWLATLVDADYIRMDFSWRLMYTNRPGQYLWNVNDGKPNKWKDELVPAMQEMDDLDMETLVTVKTNRCPGWRYDAYRDAFEVHWSEHQDDMKWWDPYKYRFPPWFEDKEERYASLWTSWAYLNDVYPTGQYEYILALLYKLADGVGAQEDVDYSIVGFCIENEPNVFRPGCYNYLSVIIPNGYTRTVYWKWVWVWDGWNSGHKYTQCYTWDVAFEIYSMADMVQDEVSYIKDKITNSPSLSDLSDCITIVNLHGFGKHWKGNNWKDLRGDPDLDYLGIDLYNTHFDTWSNIRSDIKTMWGFNKDWWLVETDGAGYPWNNGKPTVNKISRMANWCDIFGAEVLGFYRLWGIYKYGDYDKAYNIWTNPGTSPTANKDINDDVYYITVKNA